MANSKIQSMTRCAFGAALMAVCAWITVPGSVPFTLQTFGLFLLLELLGGRQGTLAVVTYLLMGAVGLPVFSGFRGGIGTLLGATGGYLSGFVVTALIYWFLSQRHCPPLLGLTLGMLGCYGFGTVWYWGLYAKGTDLLSVLCACVFPFLIPDGLKLFLAHKLSKRLKQIIGT